MDRTCNRHGEMRSRPESSNQKTLINLALDRVECLFLNMVLNLRTGNFFNG